MNQFRVNNKPTLLDVFWNITCLFRYRKRSVFFEYNAYLYRYWRRVFLGSNVYFKRNSIVGVAKKDAFIKIGHETTIGFNSIIMASESIVIGENCMIAPNVYIVDSNHKTEKGKNYNEQANVTSKVKIGDNVWIGSGTCILAGAKIDDNTVIGANSTVLRGFYPSAIYVGSPARKVKC